MPLRWPHQVAAQLATGRTGARVQPRRAPLPVFPLPVRVHARPRPPEGGRAAGTLFRSPGRGRYRGAQQRRGAAAGYLRVGLSEELKRVQPRRTEANDQAGTLARGRPPAFPSDGGVDAWCHGEAIRGPEAGYL